MLVCVVPSDDMIRHQDYVSIKLIMRDLKRSFSYTVPGDVKVLFYQPPEVSKLSPKSGDINGGTDVYLEGFFLDMSYGAIYCRFDGI